MARMTYTVNGENNLVGFKSAARVPVENLKLHFKPIQNSDTDPSPENVCPITGWNAIEANRSTEVFPFKVIRKSATNYGVSFTCDNNGVITANGTPTSWAYIVPIEINVCGNEVLYAKIYGNMTNVTTVAPTLIDSDGKTISASLSDVSLQYGVDLSQYPNVAKVNIGIKRGLNNVPMTGSCFIAVTNGAPNQQKQYAAWNQWAKPLTEENWQAYNASNNEVTFENGVATSKWLQNKVGYQSSIRAKVGISQKNKEIWYVSYMVKPSITTLSWGAEYNGGLQHTFIEQAEANEWIQCSGSDLYWKGIQGYVYFSYCRDTSKDLTGLIAQIKAPIVVNLTQMFGYGNEPTKEEFEAECVLNGLDLTAYMPYNEGQVIEWKTNRTILKQTIPISIPGKNLFNVNALFSEPSNTGESSSISRAFIPYTYCVGLSQYNYYYPNKIKQFSVSNNEISFVSENTSYGVGYVLPLSYGSYTISYTGNNIKHLVVSYDENGLPMANYVTNNATFRVPQKSVISIVLFLPSSANSTTTVSNIKVEEGIKANAYSPFDPDNSVYSGYVDAVKGELVVDWVKVTKKLSECTNKKVYDDLVFYDFWPLTDFTCYANGTNSSTINKSNSKCSIAPHRWESISSVTNHYYMYKTSNNQTRMLLYLLPESVESDDMEFEIAFQLETPLTYPLTKTQLRTYLDQNIFWSNTNDITEVSYAIHDSSMIRDAKKRIAMNQPHIEIASGN